MAITSDQLKEILPNCKNPTDTTDAINALLDQYEINTTKRVAGFLAQCGHESAQFNILHENLNYNEDGLVKVFPHYFTSAYASQYAHNPEKIANRIYANRMGNGDENSGDGYMYRGRGAIQLTGKDNYTRFAKDIGKELADTVEYANTLAGAIESACWFWKQRNINDTCDHDDIIGMTKKVNGGTIGLEERTAFYNKAKHVLGAA